MSGTSPLVPAKINGGEVYLIADTGASYNNLTAGTVAQFKLRSETPNTNAYTTGIGGTQTIVVTTVKSFSLAGLTVPNVGFTVIDNELGPQAAGLLGENILGFADGDYDLGAGSIRLVRPSGCGDKPFVLWDVAKPTSIMPMEPSTGLFKHIVGDAYVNGKRIRVMFDTGASTSLLSLDAARRAGISTDGPGVSPGGLQRGIGRRMIPSYIVPVDSFKIGDEEIKHTRLRVAPMSIDVDMLLGADFFLSHRVYVANSQRRIYFTYNGGPVFNLASTPLADTGGPAASPDRPVEAKAEPTDAEGFSRRGEAFAGRREFGPAIADLTKAVTMAPTEARYFTQRATIYLQNGQLFLAMADLDQALKLKPDDAEALVERAKLHAAGREMDRARADLDQAAKVIPKEADLRLEMAHLYERAEGGPSAIEQYDLWIKAHPEDNRLAQALNGRCWARALWNIEPDKALADCDGAVRRDRKNAAFLDSRGLAHLRLGENDKAIADYDAALAINAKIAWALYGRGVAKLREGHTAEGQADLNAAAALRPALAAEAKAHGLDK
jgi:tetratricopeptide (TPR) repeat protein/predicted aspartyl protease